MPKQKLKTMANEQQTLREQALEWFASFDSEVKIRKMWLKYPKINDGSRKLSDSDIEKMYVREKIMKGGKPC